MHNSWEIIVFKHIYCSFFVIFFCSGCIKIINHSFCFMSINELWHHPLKVPLKYRHCNVFTTSFCAKIYLFRSSQCGCTYLKLCVISSAGLSLSAGYRLRKRWSPARFGCPSLEKGQQTELLVDTHTILWYGNIWAQGKGLNKSLTTLIIGETVTSKVTEIKCSFEYLFTPCLLSVSCVLHLVNTKYEAW